MTRLDETLTELCARIGRVYACPRGGESERSRLGALRAARFHNTVTHSAGGCAMKRVALLPVVIFDVARALAQAPLDPPPVQAEIAELLVAYPNGAYFWQQTDIARRLVALGDPAVVDSIEPYLDMTNRRRRCNAAYVLAGLGDDRGVEILVQELEDTGIDERDTREGAGFVTGPPS